MKTQIRKADGNKRDYRLAIAIALGLLPFMGLACLLLPIPFTFPIGIETKQVAMSPISSIEAVVFSLDAGATTDFAYHVSIGQHLTKPDESNTVLVAGHVHGQGISVRWVGKKLVIRMPTDARVARKRDWIDFSGVHIAIEYDLVPPVDRDSWPSTPSTGTRP